jgi:hypothetical protein
MKKVIKILCVAVTMFFFLAGPSFATLYDGSGADYTFMGALDHSAPWAVLNVKISMLDNPAPTLDVYTYKFTLHVLSAADDPNAYGVEVNGMRLPVGGYDAVSQGMDGVMYMEPPLETPGELEFLWMPGIQPGETSATITLVSTYTPGEGEAMIYDGGDSPGTCVTSAITFPGGGHGQDVPEPTTLILVGIGMLGVGAYRHLSLRKHI